MSFADDPESLVGGLIPHLLELRMRILRALIGVGLVLAVTLPFSNQLYAWLAQPLLRSMPRGGQLIATGVLTPFVTPVKLAVCTALLAAMPWVLYQAWAFVAPGLYQRERRIALPLLASAVILFYLGCAFAYFGVLPAAFLFLAHTTPAGVARMTDINAYLDFVLMIFFAFGLSFELPVALVIAVLVGVVTTKQLREWRGYAVVAIFILAAIITPPDIVSQLMLAIPMCLLYEAGILASRLLRPNTASA